MFDQDTKDAIARAAEANGLPVDQMLAVAWVESRGKAYTKINGEDLPLILPEPHIFYRNLPVALRAQAVSAGLASKKWNRKLYRGTQKGRYEQLFEMRAIHNDAGICAPSYGIGQVLGQNWKSLGFDSPTAFFARVMSGVEGQADVMARFIVVNKLKDELERCDWKGFARAYNGPSYAENAYDKKMADAYAEVTGQTFINDPEILSMGSMGEGVLELQKMLKKAGHNIEPDGDFGPATKKALMAYQSENNLTADGIAGPHTRGLIEQQTGGVGEQRDTVVREGMKADLSKVFKPEQDEPVTLVDPPSDNRPPVDTVARAEASEKHAAVRHAETALAMAKPHKGMIKGMLGKYWDPNSKTWLTGAVSLGTGVLLAAQNHFWPDFTLLVEFISFLPLPTEINTSGLSNAQAAKTLIFLGFTIIVGRVTGKK